MKAAIALSMAIIFAAIGDILFSRAMRATGEVKITCLRDIAPTAKRVFANPLLFAGILSMAIHLSSYMAALALVDVSVANPLTALSYVIATAYAATIVREAVGRKRWCGVLLITIGAVLVGMSS